MSMDARFRYLLAFLTSMSAAQVVAEMPGLSVGRNQRFAFPTQNFIAYADSADVARKVAMTAERYRRELAELWLGKPLPNWPQKCPIRVRVGTLGAGGATTFRFVGGGVRDWKMRVQGSLERVLDSVVPHEVNHTVFASHFRRPLPRWADEGAATLFEHTTERTRQLRLLEQMQRQGRRYTLQQLLSMMEYPEDMQRVLTLYAQGYSLVDFLIQQGGRREFIAFLEDAGRMNWDAAIRKRYNHQGIAALDENWNGWFLAGSPQMATPNRQNPGVEVAAARQSPTTNPVPAIATSPAVLQPTPARNPMRTVPYQSSATLRPRSHAPVIAPEPTAVAPLPR